MKRFIAFVSILLLFLCACSAGAPHAQITATTLPVYEFTQRLCEGTDITVTRLVTESVSCLHDYSLNVRQVRSAEAAEVIVCSGMGLEDFLHDLTSGAASVDASRGIEPICGSVHDHDHEHDHHDDHGHSHDEDPHIWLSPENAMIMAENICRELCAVYPGYEDVLRGNLAVLLSDLCGLQAYGEETLRDLSCREIITFHDGFAYFADAFGLTILEAVEEESGSEASAQELKHLIGLVNEYNLPAIFIETNGSVSAAEVIARETGAEVFSLDMAMGGDSYFDAMYHNIDTIKEALG